MRDQHHVMSAAEEVRSRLVEFSGFHRPPDAWLHMTVLAHGSTDDISRGQMLAMLASAQKSLRTVEPVSVSIGRILYHPEAIMLAVEPSDQLLVARESVIAATEATSPCLVTIGDRESWIPHVTVLYSTAEQEAAPLIAAAGRTVPPREVEVDTISLVIQWGPEKSWDWEIVGSVRFDAKPNHD